MSESEFDRQGFREWSKALFGARAAEVERLVDRMLRARKRIRRSVACSNCGHVERKEFEVHDDKVSLDCLRWLTEAGFGRPAQAANEAKGETMIVNRVITVCGDDCPCKAKETGE